MMMKLCKVTEVIVGIGSAMGVTAVIIGSLAKCAKAEKELKETKKELEQLKLETLVKDTTIDYLSKLK